MSQSSIILFLQLPHPKIPSEKLEEACCSKGTLERVKVRHLHFSISATTNTSMKQFSASKAGQKAAKATLKEKVSTVWLNF